MSNFSYRPAKASDALRISVLFKQVYIETYGTKGVSWEFTNFITKRFAPEGIEQIIHKDPEQLLIAHNDDCIIGASEVHFDATCSIRKSPFPELDKLYILKNFHGKGVGYGLLNLAEKIVRDRGHHQFFLEVYEGNSRAIAFYNKHGYEVIGEVDFVMTENTYLNKVMNKSLL